MKLSIVIPAYNEERRIVRALEDYAKFFTAKYKDNFEILVVANGCRDNTVGVVKEVAKRYKQIKYKDIKEPIGKGGAVIEGFKLVNGELIGFVDADDSTSSEVFYDLIKKINGYDGIIASRWTKGSIIKPRQPLSRRIASRCFNMLVRILFGINVSDSQCGAKLLKRNVVKSVVNDLGITRWAFDVDLLYNLKRKNFKFIEIPTVWSDTYGSKLDVVRTSIEMFLAISRLRLIYSPFKFIVNIYDKINEKLK